ncbi:hypothetical protein AB0J82_36785 [Asanoa sp. NPDC049518]|uniref:hypothetical protein n=1 Tax=unclassified Asanoa TaxID=2685164 RepID=UPI003440F31B
MDRFDSGDRPREDAGSEDGDYEPASYGDAPLNDATVSHDWDDDLPDDDTEPFTVASDAVHERGPAVVRGLYLSRQVVTAVRGMADGNGFDLKVSIPGVDLLDGVVLPSGFQLAAHVRLGHTLPLPDGDGGVDIRPEIQFFEPWCDAMDVAPIRQPGTATSPLSAVARAQGIGPAPDSEDPWRVLLVLLGDDLIHNLARTLTSACALPPGRVLEALRRERAAARPRYRTASTP